MSREAIKQAIVEHLERETGLLLNDAKTYEWNNRPDIALVFGFPALITYTYTWTGDRWRFKHVELHCDTVLEYVGCEAARAAAEAGKGAG